MSHDAAEHGIQVTGGPYVPDDDDEGDLLPDEFPPDEKHHRVCVHGQKVWFGHECGACETAGVYVWA